LGIFGMLTTVGINRLCWNVCIEVAESHTSCFICLFKDFFHWRPRKHQATWAFGINIWPSNGFRII
jgi:hypothetical protein